MIKKGEDLENSMKNKLITSLTILMIGSALHAMDVGENRIDQKRLNLRLLKWVKSGNTQRVRVLLEQGADVNATDDLEESALMWAVKTNKLKMCKFLIENGADVNATHGEYEETALMWAADHGRLEACQLLINAGANIYAKSEDGMTALMWAAGRGDREVCKLLISEMVKPTKEQKDLVVALLGSLKKTAGSEHLQRDTRRLIAQMKFNEYKNENKAKAEVEINKIADEALRKELLNYLKSI